MDKLFFEEEHHYIFDKPGTFLMKELLGIEEEIEQSQNKKNNAI